MSHTKKLYATLIGINAYKQHPLNGCIRDVLAIDRLLREQCLQQREPLTYEPLLLLAPNESDRELISEYTSGQNSSPDFESPTFANVTQKAFQHLKKAKDSDICVFYFSGHGSQTEAPEVFWHTKSDRKNETLVCLDSRDSDVPEARDLVDKEIAFLLWDALRGKNVHALVIMDSCHSGNITRSMADEKDTARYRFVAAASSEIPFADYIGSASNAFYEMKGGRAYFKMARYVHLAAARDYQKARETREGGLFTSKFVALLRSGGSSLSYRELIRNLSADVHLHNPQQDPVAFSPDEEDLNRQFLGDDMVPYIPSFEVRYRPDTAQWIMNGGSQHGITPPAGSVTSTVKIIDSPFHAVSTGAATSIEIWDVAGDFSILDQAGMAIFDKSRSDYKAIVTRLANTAIRVGISKELLAKKHLTTEVLSAYSNAAFVFFNLASLPNADVDYLIDITENDHFVLTRPHNGIPLFKRERNAASFLRNTEHVGKWLNTLEVKNKTTYFSKKDFIFSIERIEGQSFEGVDRELLKGDIWSAEPDEEILFNYADNHQPAFRFSVAIAPESSLQSCFVAALYLDSLYGISTGLIRSDSGKLEKSGSPLHLGILRQETEIHTIRLNIDPGYDACNINEIMDYLKIFVAENPLDLSRYQQKSLDLDVRGEKGIDTELFSSSSTSRRTDWTVFDFKFRIAKPRKEKTLIPGRAIDFGEFSIEVPAGFAARAFAVTGDDLLRKQKSAQMRGMEHIIQPVTIWGENINEPAFSPPLASGNGSAMEILELRSVDGAPLHLPAGESLILRPNGTKAGTRSLEESEEVIIPCGFDEISELWYPVGSSDNNGYIHIDFLPSETSGSMQETGSGSKSIGGSVKLFFRKLFRKKTRLNTLVLYGFKPNGDWEEITKDNGRMEEKLRTKPQSRIILLTHGLTGDTRHMVAALKELKELSGTADFVLTYDYENLSTPIDDAARALHRELTSIGFGKMGMAKLTIIAHSHGGLLSRWLVEQEGGSAYVDQLILVAVASSGSELAKLGSAVFSLLTHALNVTGPIQWAISGLSLLLKALKSDPGRALKDTNPGSPFIGKLRNSVKPDHVLYNVIIGDLSLINRELETDDKFLEKLKKVLAENLVVPWFTQGLYAGQPNDIAVTVSSATAITGYEHPANTRIVASNHLAYFRKSLAQKELMEFLTGRDV